MILSQFSASLDFKYIKKYVTSHLAQTFPNELNLNQIQLAEIVFRLCVRTIKTNNGVGGNLAFSSFWTVCFAFPTFLIEDDTDEIVKMVFQSQERALIIEFLQCLAEYLGIQKGETATVGNEIKELIGTSSSYASAGIPSAMIQRYLDRILNLLQVDSKLYTTKLILKIITRSVSDGLTYPLSCLPGICILESSDDIFVRKEALTLHRNLADRYESFIHTRHMDCITAVYRYKSGLDSSAEPKGKQKIIIGYRKDNGGEVSSMLDPLYSTIPGKRGRHHEFVKAIVKLAIETSDLKMVGFISEAIATLHFKTSEEVNEFSLEIARSTALSADALKGSVEDFENGIKISNGNLVLLAVEMLIRKYVSLMHLQKVLKLRSQQNTMSVNLIRAPVSSPDIQCLRANQNLRELIPLV